MIFFSTVEDKTLNCGFNSKDVGTKLYPTLYLTYSAE